MKKPRIFADFSNGDKLGRLRLITHGTYEDIEKQKIKLTDGMLVILYDDELSVDGEVTFSDEEKIWVAKIDWTKIKRTV